MKAYSALLYLPSTAQGRNKISAYDLLADQSYRAGIGNKNVHFSKFQLGYARSLASKRKKIFSRFSATWTEGKTRIAFGDFPIVKHGNTCCNLWRKCVYGIGTCVAAMWMDRECVFWHVDVKFYSHCSGAD